MPVNGNVMFFNGVLMRNVVLIMFLFISGCASNNVALQPYQSLIKGEGSEKGELLVARERAISFGPRPYFIVVDGVPIFELKNGSYTIFPIEAGEHKVLAMCNEVPTEYLFTLGLHKLGGEAMRIVNIPNGGREAILFGPGGIKCATVKSVGEVDTSKLKYIKP